MMALHSSVGKCYFFVLALVVFVPSQVVNALQVYPSEYIYLDSSVKKSERDSANCRRYPPMPLVASIHSEDYTHCDGTQLRLTDSDLGSEQYSRSDYYVWNAGSSSQLLFIFSTRVNLTTITLHYYSDVARSLPRLRFYAVPDDFNVWDAPVSIYSLVDIAAVPPGGEPADLRNVSVNFNTSLRKILMFKSSNSYTFAVSEVEFFTQCIINHPYTTSNMMTTTSTSNSYYPTETNVSHSSTDMLIVSSAPATTTGSNTESSQDQYESTDSICQGDTALAWALFGVVTVLFIVSLTVNVIMVALWVYKKREVKGQTGRPSEFEIEGNPCYEATQMKQTSETETHVYETVQGKRGK